jgi:hypothetical protein
MDKRKVYGFLIIISLCFGCYGKKDAIGTYIGNHPFSADTLFVLSNGTFKQHFVAKGVSYINCGSWNYNGKVIDFNNFISYLPGYGPNDKRKVYWQAKVNFWHPRQSFLLLLLLYDILEGCMQMLHLRKKYLN